MLSLPSEKVRHPLSQSSWILTLVGFRLSLSGPMWPGEAQNSPEERDTVHRPPPGSMSESKAGLRFRSELDQSFRWTDSLATPRDQWLLSPTSTSQVCLPELKSSEPKMLGGLTNLSGLSGRGCSSHTNTLDRSGDTPKHTEPVFGSMVTGTEEHKWVNMQQTQESIPKNPHKLKMHMYLAQSHYCPSQYHLAIPLHFGCLCYRVGHPNSCWDRGVGWSVDTSNGGLLEAHLKLRVIRTLLFQYIMVPFFTSIKQHVPLMAYDAWIWAWIQQWGCHSWYCTSHINADWQGRITSCLMLAYKARNHSQVANEGVVVNDITLVLFCSRLNWIAFSAGRWHV